jgi:membrane protease YdiL (CAAX protease family)
MPPVTPRSDAVPRATTDRPIVTALLGATIYALALLVWLLLPWEQGTGSVAGRLILAGVGATRVLVCVAFLSALGLWRASGLTTRGTRRGWLIAVPLAVPAVLPLAFGAGVADRPAWVFVVGALSTATVAFGEEAMFRGVVLRLLLRRGIAAAVVGSSAAFALMHLVNLAGGGHPVEVGAQVLMTFGMGIGFAAVALVTGTIWPLVVVHLALDYANAVQAAVAAASGTGLADDLVNGGINVLLGVLWAAYGGWLLRRHPTVHAGNAASVAA